MSVRNDQIQSGLTPGAEGLMASTVSVALLDRDGVVVSLNPAWLDLARRNGADADLTAVGDSYLEAWAAAGDTLVAIRVTDAIRAALRGDLPTPMSVRTRSPHSDLTRWVDQSIASRFADSGAVLGATITLSPSDFGSDESRFRADGLRDNVVGSVFGAGLALDGLVERLSDLDDKRILDTAVDHLNDIVRQIRLMSPEIDVQKT